MQAMQTTLALQKPPYSAEWLDSLLMSISNMLHSLSHSFWSANIGQTDSAAHRLLGLILATAAFLILRTKNAARFRLSHHGPFSLQTAVLISLLLLMVRWGATEQLFVLIALASLACTAPASSKLDSDRRQTLRWLAVSALALACANSRTWIYSLVPATFFWILLQPRKAQLFKQASFTLALFTAAFIGLFMTLGSFETFVGHLTQRWLHLNEPRYLSVVWQGAVLPWKVMCLWMALLNLRRLAAAAAGKLLTSRESFAQLLIVSAAAQLCYFQKTPAAADVLFLGLLTASQTPRLKMQSKTLFVNLASTLLWAFIAGIACTIIISSILLLSPTTRTVPDLAATIAGMERLWKNFPALCLSALFLALSVAYFLFGALRGARAGNSRRAASFGHFALCSAVAFLYCASELRSRFIWDALNSSIATLPRQTQLFYLPKLEPLIQLLPQTPHRKRMAGIYQGESVLQEEQRSMLLIPVEVSEVCQSAGWNVETTHGIFALCDTGQGAIFHLLPMN